jgi:predicted DNA-binding ribbon-helix-helix protein
VKARERLLWAVDQQKVARAYTPFDEAPRVPDVTGNMEGVMKSPVIKRSIAIAGHKTSVSLEDAFWKGLKEIATGCGLTLSEMVATIDSGRAQGNLSSALRLFVLDHYRAQIGIGAERVSGIEREEGKPLSLAVG